MDQFEKLFGKYQSFKKLRGRIGIQKHKKVLKTD
ncbi:uncharacterized protein METZ01_LOCUS369895 [marine metagenome]|uniref:Uncharacterized protein n=1 Tax=marine metagenome TaxID=408172 RepID=A0A382T6V4_9ZZZZ